MSLNNSHFGKNKSITVTTCDTDSLFHPNYFSVLEMEYNAANPALSAAPRMCVWQSPLFYNWDLDQRPFFNRITGIMRSMMMLGGLISFSLNPMSIFSYPVELGLKAGFINPRYGVDDIIAKVRWMCCTNESVPVLLLPVPSISGPTIGTTWLNEVDEWARQIRRWIVGSSESFHYFLIHWRGEPLFQGALWFFLFFMYYAVLLCSAGIFTLLAGIPFPWIKYSSVSIAGYELSLSSVPLISLVVQYLVFGVAFLIDRRAVRAMRIKEEIGVLRNVLHWLLAPPTLLVYSLISFYAIISFIWNGKKMARHDMAANTAAAANAPGSSQQQQQQQEEELNSLIHAEDIYLEGRQQSADRRRSTSTDLNSATNQNMAPKLGLLCVLPERFYFGEYSETVAHAMQRINAARREVTTEV